MKRTIIYLCFSLCAVAVSAQTTPDTLLLRYRQMALEYNDDLKAAAKNIGVSIELECAARADRITKLFAVGEFQYTGNPLELSAELPGVGPLTFQGQDVKYGASLALRQPIYTGGRILETIRLAESQKTIAESQHQLLRSLVCFQVDVQYWNTVARYEMVQVAQDFRNAMGELTRIVCERVEAGLTDRQELLTAEVKLNEAEYQLLQMQSDFETGLMALNALIGAPLDAKTTLGVQVLPIENIATTICDTPQRPEIFMAQENIEMEKTGLRLNDAQYKPQLYAGADGGYFSPGYNFRPDMNANYTVYAGISIPIFEGYKRRREKKAYEYRIGMAEDNMHKIETDVELEKRTAWTSLTQAQKRIELASASLYKAQENERRAAEKYEEGTISIADVIDAQIYRQTAEINHVTAKTAAQIHYAELLKAVNGYDCR